MNLPLDEVNEGLLDHQADLVIDFGNVRRIYGPDAVGHLIICEAFTLIVARYTLALGRRRPRPSC